MVSRKFIYLVAASLFLISLGASADTTPPEWRNLQDNVTDYVKPGQPVNISAEFRDNESGLDGAILATNETGEWQNYSGTWVAGETRNYTFRGPSKNDSKYNVELDAGTYEIEVYGADGGDGNGDPYGVGGDGGYIKGEFTAEGGDTLEIWVGQDGGEADTYEGGWGRHKGGVGNTSTLPYGAGGSGGGSTEILLNNDFLAAADGGGGGGAYVSYWGADAAGGGGARGGSSGISDTGHDGEDAKGTGFGGDGGGSDGWDGEDGGQEAGEPLTVIENQTGGSTNDSNGHGYVEITLVESQSKVEKQSTLSGFTNNWTVADFLWQNSSFSGTFGYRIWAQDNSSNWRSTETQSFVVNQPPVIHGTWLNWTGIGGNTERRIRYSISDPDGNQISSHNQPPSGSEKKFTNDSYRIHGINFPFDYTAEVTDVVGAIASVSTDISTTDSGYQERITFDHSIESQRVKRTAGITNNGDGLNYTLSMAEIGTVVQGGFWNGSLGPGNSISKTSIWEGDYITGETEETYSKYSDYDYSHTEDRQRIHNRTRLLADNSHSFTFHDVDISSICNRTSTADVSSGSNTLVTDDCNRLTFTGDWISESLSQEYADSNYNHTINSQKITRTKTLSEEGGYSWSQIEIAPPSISGTCTGCNTRTRDLPASASITETYHATSDWIKTESTTSLSQDPSYSHDLDTQRVEKNKTLNETGGYSFTEVDVPNPSLPGKILNGGRDVNLSGSESVTLTYNAEGDWIVNESHISVAKDQNPSKTSSLTTQHVFNHTKLKADLNLSIPLTDVDLSEVCSIDTTGGISPSDSVLADECTNKTYSVDRVDESLSEVHPVKETVLIGSNIRATRKVSVTNNAEYSLENLSTTDSLGQTACAQENRTEVDLAGNSSKEIAVGYECDSGSVSDVEREVLLNTPSNFYDTVKLSFKVHVPSNVTDESDLQIMLNRDNAPEWSDRESSSVDLNASGTGIDISSTERNIYITIPDDYGNSSLHKGTYNGILKYRYKTASEGGGGGGTGGGAPPGPEPSPQPKNNSTIKASFDTNSPYEFGYGTTRKKFITVYNFDKEPNQVTIEKQDSQACQFVDVKSAVNTREPYRDELTTTVPSKTQGTYRESSSLLIKTRFKIPSKAKLQRMGLAGNFTCSFDTKSNRGKAANLSLTVTPVQKSSIGKSLVRVRDQCLSTDLEKAWSYPETGECPGTVVGVPVPTKASAPWLGTLLLGVLVFGWIRW